MRVYSIRRRMRPARGTALALAIVLSAIVSGLVLTLAWAAGITSQTAGSQARVDQAYCAAEAGAQRALWKYKYDNTWRATAGSPLTGTLAMGASSYSYAVTCVDAPANPWGAVARWKLDENTGATTADAVGTATGTLVGGASWASGRWNKAVALNGTNGHIDAGTSASLNLSGAVAVAGWVLLNDTTGTQVVAGNQNGSYGGYKLTLYGGKVEFEVRNGTNDIATNRDTAGGTALTAGTWYHVAGAYSPTAGTITTYVNGVLDRTQTGVAADALTATGSHFYIGREPSAPTSYLKGTVDDVQVFARALQASEVTSLDTGGQVLVTSTASGGGVSATVAMLAANPASPVVTVAITMAATVDIKNVDVIGDVQVVGNLASSTGQSTITGNVKLSGACDLSHLTITGTVTTGPVTPSVIDYAAIEAVAGRTYNGNQSGTTFDFTTVSGANKVIYVNGRVTNPVFVGSGTLYARGNISFTNNGTTIGSAGNPIHLVTNQNITFTGNNATVFGSLFAGGSVTWTKLTMTGMLSATGMLAAGPARSTVTIGAAPWFAPISESSSTAPPTGAVGYGLFAEPLP